MNAPNIENLRIFLDEYKTLPDEVVNMQSCAEPVCGTPGCFGGDVSIVFNALKAKGIETPAPEEHSYSYQEWADCFAEFLWLYDSEDLIAWAKSNPVTWGNIHGKYMFTCPEAWGVDRGPCDDATCNRSIIQAHWEGVYSRLVDQNKEPEDVAIRRQVQEILTDVCYLEHIKEEIK
jgi:hypothetical protein